MRFNWHFLAGGNEAVLASSFVSPAKKGWSPNQTTGILSLRAPSGRPSCDATATKLCVIDLISQHDESPDQQPPSDGYFGGGVTTTHRYSSVDNSQLPIMPRGHLAGFYQQQT